MKNEKICWIYHHFTRVHQKSQSYDVQFLKYRVRETKHFVILGHFLPFYLRSARRNFCHFGQFFCPFTPLTTQKINIKKKNEKNTCRCYYFTQVYHKWQSYDVWFLRYEAWQTEFLSFWTVFCSFTPLTTQKIKILKNWKKCLAISFYTSVQKIMTICYTVP